MIYDDAVDAYRKEAREQIESTEKLPGVFGEMQKIIANVEVEMAAVKLQTERNKITSEIVEESDA